MLYLLVWWLILLIIGCAALPVTYRFFQFLPDRGYAFSKPLGLLLLVFPFWLLASFGFLQNTFGALAVILLLVAVLSWVLLRGKGDSSLHSWAKVNWRYILFVEIVFSFAFFAFAYFRSFNPEITATEKPMEFMFLNSVLHSTAFPPHDSWLSGYAISYYYLGYVMVAALSKLSAVPSNFAFNLGLTTIYALAATGAFGVVFNLVRGMLDAKTPSSDAPAPPAITSSPAPYLSGLLAVFLLLIAGNLEAPFESLYNAGVGPREFYTWLDLHGLDQVNPSGTLIPSDNWWWWRASRVVNDHNPTDGGAVEVIDEFPAFSFLLGDLHPHVLALPFCLLALAVALNLIRSQPADYSQSVDSENSLNEQAISKPAPSPSSALLALLAKEILTPRMLLTSVVVGALGMLNTWDIVTYGLIIVASFGISRYRRAGHFTTVAAMETISFAVVLFAASYLLYLPFYLGFSSQFHGVAPNIFSKTPLHQYLIMFGLFVFCLTSFLAVLVWERRRAGRALARQALAWAVPLLAVPVVIAIAGLAILAQSVELRTQVASLLSVSNTSDVSQSLLTDYVQALISNPWVFLLLTALIAVAIAVGRQVLVSERIADNRDAALNIDSALLFVLLITIFAFVLTFGVEFLYIRDVFETRMNTVFKLYYQSWTLLALASAFGVYYIWARTRGIGRALWVLVFAFLLGLSLVYPIMAYPNRANSFKASARDGTPTLDGTAWIEQSFPDDFAAIEWLNSNARTDAVILEAVGREYSFDDRVSMATGLPTVLGWAGHELQWRGNYDDAGPREHDVERAYKTLDANEARGIMDKYGVEYVVIGSSERDKYQLTPSMMEKFAKLGELVFNQDSIKIYQVSQ